MDLVTLLIIGGVVVLVAIVVILLVSKDKGGNMETPPAENPGGDKKESVASKRFKQVLSGSDLSNQMKKEEEEELLTKYTPGTGEGIAEVEKLLVSDPNNVDLLDWLAFMYYSNNDVEKAVETYKRALAIKPSNEHQHYYLGNSFFKKGLFAEAQKEWSEVIRLKPNSKIAKNAQERIDFIATSKK